MKKLKTYLWGAMIGMISEYCFRVEFGYLQGFILVILILGMIIDVIESWNK